MKSEDQRSRNWAEHAVWWQVYPLGFVGAEREASACTGVMHRLDHLVGWLDYAVNLSASGILLGPVFASSTHGYDTVDHFQIDKRLGDEADFEALVKAAHDRGLRFVLDGVFNHVGREHPLFQRALAAGPHSPEAAWFRLTRPADDALGEEPDYATFEGHRQLVALNHAEPPVADYLTRVMTHWLDRGADGWRLDAAYAVPRRFWAHVLPAVRAQHPDAYVFGEVIHGDYAGFVRDTGVDSVTQYELWKAIWSALNDRNCFELAWALDRHNVLLDTFVPQTFIGNHDVTRIASQLLDERHLAHALVILLTCGGLPSIYAGDEQAFRGIKEQRAGGDDAIRPVFPATPAGLAPFGWPIYRLHQELIGLRRRHPWLHKARSRVTELRNTDFTFEAFHEGNRLWVVLNVADAPIVRTLPAAVDKLIGDLAVSQTGATTEVALPPHGWGIFAMQSDGSKLAQIRTPNGAIVPSKGKKGLPETSKMSGPKPVARLQFDIIKSKVSSADGEPTRRIAERKSKLEEHAMSEFVFLFRARKPMGSAEQQQKTLQKWGAWMTDLNQRGLMANPGLPLQDMAKRVAGPDRVVHDGPFAEIKDLVNGFIVVTADDIDAACEIAKGCPIFEQGGGVEVRPVASMTP